VTEITQTSPQELALVRKSHVGFTGFELATLSAWMDSPGFPLTFEMPARLPGAKPGSPAVRTNAPSTKTNTVPAKAATSATQPKPATPSPGIKR
jgi:hypothetical protein